MDCNNVIVKVLTSVYYHISNGSFFLSQYLAKFSNDLDPRIWTSNPLPNDCKFLCRLKRKSALGICRHHIGFFLSKELKIVAQPLKQTYLVFSLLNLFSWICIATKAQTWISNDMCFLRQDLKGYSKTNQQSETTDHCHRIFVLVHDLKMFTAMLQFKRNF